MEEEIVKKRFPFFESGLRNAILKEGTYREFDADEELIREDQFIRSFPIVISGLIKVCRTDETGNELLLYYLQTRGGLHRFADLLHGPYPQPGQSHYRRGNHCDPGSR